MDITFENWLHQFSDFLFFSDFPIVLKLTRFLFSSEGEPHEFSNILTIFSYFYKKWSNEDNITLHLHYASTHLPKAWVLNLSLTASHFPPEVPTRVPNQTIG